MSLILDETTSSGTEKRNVVLSELPTTTNPFCNVKNLVVASFVVPTFISPILIFAIAAVFERGT